MVRSKRSREPDRGGLRIVCFDKVSGVVAGSRRSCNSETLNHRFFAMSFTTDSDIAVSSDFDVFV